MFHIADISRMASRLVETATVQINFEDFNESFLTCGTCLCSYDAQEHTPKLLPCSHTVCKSCLERIVEAGRDRSQIRCPICRGGVAVPAGGVGSFPPSFLVNQLLDLMARQRRDVIPKCGLHPAQELMFCESCGQVFCMDCEGGSHNGRGASAHTVIPYSIAIKRMSEILLYKASQCTKNLQRAAQVVEDEMENVNANSEKCLQTVDATFDDVIELVQARRAEMVHAVKRVCSEKRRVLREQLDIIETEKQRVQTDCQELQAQLEGVPNISKKIADLNEKLDSSSNLIEPRENAFVQLEFAHNTALKDVRTSLGQFGRIRISKTFPALCTAALEPPVIHLNSRAVVKTVDYHGNARSNGTDPLVAWLKHLETGDRLACAVNDLNTGQYHVDFTVANSGSYELNIEIFERPIGQSPLSFVVSEHNNPLRKVGGRGAGPAQFVQPIGIALDADGAAFVLDTGNSRVQKLLTPELVFDAQLSDAGLEEHSGTGLALRPDADTLVLTNWRTKHVTELDRRSGDVVRKFTHAAFVEPIAVAVNGRGEIIVADNGLGQLLVFNDAGHLVDRLASKGDKAGQLKLITSVCAVANSDHILVTDHRLQLFHRNGSLVRQYHSNQFARGRYGGATVDKHGNVLATHQDKHGARVLYFHSDGTLKFAIDSHDDRLKRPSGLVTTGDGHVIVVDLGNDALKTFRYI